MSIETVPYIPPAPYVEIVDPAIQCSACDAVCCRQLVVLMPDDVIPRWLTDHDDRGLEIMARGSDGWCKAVDRETFRCTIYERRPFICRSFSMGGEYCKDARAEWLVETGGQIPVTLIDGTG